jgi:FkbM family methyltransferase
MWWKRLARGLLPAGFWRTLQALRLNRSIANYPKRIVRHRYGEGELEIELGDPLAAGWYDHDWAALPEVGLLRQSRLRSGAVVFDLGAHQGVVALMLAREVGPTGKVIAVEAMAHNAAAAVRNRELNRMPWVEVVSAAVAGQDGTLTLSRGLNAQLATVSDYAGTIEVPAVTIDTLAGRYGPPDLIYLDVEGMEVEALKGAVRTLSARPAAFVEVHTRHGLEAAGGTVSEVLAFFPDTEYESYVHSEQAVSPIPLTTAPLTLLADRFFLTAIPRQPPNPA